MVNRVGTSSGSLSESTGGVTDELGNQLLGTDTSTSEAQTLGPQLAREVITGFPNADFALLPPGGLDTPLSEDNDLPFFTAYPAGDAVNNTIEAAVVTSAAADSGRYELRFSAPEGTDDGSEYYVERWIPIPGDYAGSYYAYPTIHAYCLTPGDNAEFCYLDVEATWYDANLNFLDEYLDYWSFDELSGLNAAGIYGRTVSLPNIPEGFVSQPAEAKWVKFRFGITVNPGAALTSTEELYITGLRMARAVLAPNLTLDRDPADFNSSYGGIDVQTSDTSLIAERGSRDSVPYTGLLSSLTLKAGPSDPTENAYLTHTNLSPHGARYTGPVTAATTGTDTTLNLTNAPASGAGMANAASDEIPLYPGVYLIVADVSFESNGSGTYRRVFIRNEGTNIGAATTGVNGASLAYRLSATALYNVLPNNINVAESGLITVAAQQNSGSTLDVTLHSLTLVRLGDCW